MGISRSHAGIILIVAMAGLGMAVHANSPSQNASQSAPASLSLAVAASPADTRPAAPEQPFVATVANEHLWRPDRVPTGWPQFTKLPNEKPLPAKSVRQKIDLANSVNARWQAFYEKKAKTYPSSAESSKAIEYMLSVDPKSPEFPEAWASFITLRQADRSISSETALDGGRKLLAARAKDRGVSIGMTADEIRSSSWGKPKSINQTITARGKREQWVYSGGYLYLEDGVLNSIQTSR